jgi:DNA polymerase-3 subunit epsilon/ATP-dependent DNA helicase DinG
MRGDLVAIDLETTGLDLGSAHIIEIGAVKFRNHEVIETFSTLIDPQSEIPAKITAITGIRQDHLVGAPRINAVLPKISQFVGDSPVVGHNIDFDLHFLQRHGILSDNVAIDTYEMASVLLPTAPRYNLNALMQRLNLEPDGDYHRALADAQATVRVYTALWDKLINELPLDLLREIVRATQRLPWKGFPPFADALAARGGSIDSDVVPGPLRGFHAPAAVAKPLQSIANRVPLDAEALTASLSPGGTLAQALPYYTTREQQIEMLRAVCAAFNNHQRLMVEAPVGTGRSLAYLLPAAMWAAHNGERVVVSANTQTLQNQLLQQEIPRLNQALGLDIRATMLKGRGDYLCPRRLETLRRRLPTSVDELRVFSKIQVWLNEADPDQQTEQTEQSERGDQGDPTEDHGAAVSLRGPSEYSVWSRLSAQHEECTVDICEARMNGICPFYHARRAAESAHIIIVNHAFLLSDAALRERRALPDYKHLIVDEAHNLEDATTYSLRFRLNSAVVSQQLADLGTKKTGLLGDVLASTQSILPAKFFDQIKGFVSVIIDAVAKMQHHVDNLFSVLLDFLKATNNLRAADYLIQVRLSTDLRNKPEFSQVKAAWTILSQFTSAIADAMTRLSTSLPALRGRYEVPHLEDLISGVGAAARHLTRLHRQFDAVIGNPEPNTIYWIEISQTLDAISIHGAPLHVSELLQNHLWSGKETVVVTSPTLCTAGSFGYIRQVLGIEANQELALSHAYDYKESTLIFLPTDMPEPQDRNKYQQYVDRGIIELATALNGRLLVLFTGYTQMRQVAQNIAPRLALGSIQLFDQSDGTSREALLEGFKNAEKAVLLGTRTFWEDVDLPTSQLAAVVIVRLPFAVPTDPVVAARAETFDNSFDQYTVPDAILRFRQGFDRLIRARTGKGVVAIFDRRMTSKGYGGTFLDSLPACTIHKAPMADLAATAKAWIGDS